MSIEEHKTGQPGHDDSGEKNVASQPSQNLADDTPPNSLLDTNDGLELLERVREKWPVWPAADEQLDPEAKNQLGDLHDLQWGISGAPPEKLGRFQVVRELGRGGFGVVLLARDPNLDQLVALKIPLAETLLSPEARDRMAREARAATILSHPAIVPVYETGELATIPYISYGYCEGESLSEWLAERRGKISPKPAAAIVSRLAEAIQHAHSRGIIHRDLKPSNILLAESDENQPGNDDEQSFVDGLRVADFGLAKVQSAKSDVSRTGVPLGTPAYMSPEQTRGEIPGPATDVFSLGVILYELLTGETPFRRENDVATLRAVDLQPHSAIPAASAPKDLAAICDKCLQKRPEDRYATAQALHDDLQRYLVGEPVVARPVGSLTRVSRWCTRNRALAASLMALLAVMAAATVFSTIMWTREQTARTLAEDNEKQASVAANEARQQAESVREIVNKLLLELMHVPTPDVQALTPLLEKLLTSYHEQICGEDSSDPVIQMNHFTTLEHLASLHRQLGNHQDSADIFHEALDYVKQYRPQEIGRHAYFQGLVATELRAAGKQEQAIELAREAVRLQREATVNGSGPRCSRNLLIAHLASYAEIIFDVHPEEAKRCIDEAIELTCELTGKQPRDWPPRQLWNSVLRDKMQVSAELKSMDEAESYAEFAIRNLETLLDSNRRSYALNELRTVYDTLAAVDLYRKDYAKAKDHCEAGLAFADELIERHPQLPTLHTTRTGQVNQLIGIESAIGHFEEARKLIAENLARIKSGRDEFPKHDAAWDLAEDRLHELTSSLNETRQATETTD